MSERDTKAGQPLHESLLHDAAVPSERKPDRRWVYPLWGILLVSVFVAFHVSHLLVFNTPSKGLMKRFHTDFYTKGKGKEYFAAARLSQSWGMFAPNPPSTNTFIRVIVTDQDGDLWDFEQDIYKENRYPYLWYDRRGKINRRLSGKKHYQRIYGAWVCREWERQHGGVPPRSVTFMRGKTKIPTPEEVLKNKGWDPWAAPYRQTRQETIVCKTVVNGQLPPYLRERFGLPPLEDEDIFRPARQQTWWDKAERERKQAERTAKRDAMRSKRGNRPTSERPKNQTERDEQLRSTAAIDEEEADDN